MSDEILIAEVKKTIKLGNDFGYRQKFVSFDRDKLKKKIEEYYKIELIKDDSNEFPYFTDGGFKYHGENDNFIFDVEAHLYDII